MTRTLLKVALGTWLTILIAPPDASAGRGGGGGYRGGGGGGYRGGEGGGYRGGEGGGYRGGEGQMGRSPSFSQPHPQSGGSQYGNNNSHGAAAAGAGAGYANRNQQPNHPNAAPAAAGAGYANRNNQSRNYPNAAPAAAGAAYANRNNYGRWNGNYGAAGLGYYGGVGMASPSYGYGASPYINPYAGAGLVGGNPAPYDYSQPINTAATTDAIQATDPGTSPLALAQQAFQGGDYDPAYQLAQQALGQSPNDANIHQFLALCLFAQGNYEQAAAPLYAVLAVGPGWNWTTLITNYSDAGVYTAQLRGLEAFARANPGSAKAEFVLAYQYISQGQGSAAIKPLRNVVALQPNDQVAAQLLGTLLPPDPAALAAQPLDPSLLPGVWVAQAMPNATITLGISDDTNFTWSFAAPGKPAVPIAGTYTLANGVLSLNGKDASGGPLAGRVASIDATHMSFKAVGAPAGDPGLQFAR